MRRAAALAGIVVFVGSAGAQVQHGTEPPKETLRRTPYTNCDKGYAVDLPRGVVAHANPSPMPNHGFLISASDPGTTADVTPDDRRFVAVFDEYDALELRSARAYLNRELQETPGKTELQVRDVVFRAFAA